MVLPFMKRPEAAGTIDKVRAEDAAEIHDGLIRASVKDSTARTYKSRLRVLGAFLAQLRGSHVECPAVSCTEEEFVRFLGFIAYMRGTTADSTRSALLLEHAALQSTPGWLLSTDLKRMVKGVSNLAARTVRVPVSKVHLKQLRSVLHETDIKCSTCNGSRAWKNRLISALLAVDLLVAEPLRPGDLVNLRIADITDDGDAGMLRLSTTKTTRCGLVFALTFEGLEVLRCAADIASREAANAQGFLFPACIRAHLNDAFAVAKSRWGWESDVLITAHSCRHALMSAKLEKLARLHGALECNVSEATFRHYSATELERKKRIRVD